MDKKQLFFSQNTNSSPSLAGKACAFTGHRELGEDFSARKLKKQIKQLMESGVTTFFNGVAVGFDLLSAEYVLELKKKFPDVKLIACVPCYGQEKNYSEQDKERYARIIKEADEVVTLAEYYFRGCMQKRDRYMVDNADLLICYCRKSTGGTAYTVRYFEKTHGEEYIFPV